MHRTAVVSVAEGGLSEYESAVVPTGDAVRLDLASGDHQDLTRAGKAARSSKAKNAGLYALVRRVAHWRAHRMRGFLAAPRPAQAEPLVARTRHQDVRRGAP